MGGNPSSSSGFRSSRTPWILAGRSAAPASTCSFTATAIPGILGVRTLGFYVDSALSELRFDRVLVLLIVTALLNIGVDACSRRLRSRPRLKTQVGVA